MLDKLIVPLSLMEPEGLLPCSKDPANCRILNMKNSFHVLFDGICLRTLISSLTNRGRPSSYLGFSHPSPYAPYALSVLGFCVVDADNWRRVQIMKLLSMQFSPGPCCFLPLRPKISCDELMEYILWRKYSKAYVVLHYLISFSYHCRMLELLSLTAVLKHCGFPSTDTWELLETGGICNSGSLHPWWIPYVYASTQRINFLRRRGSVAGISTR